MSIQWQRERVCSTLANPVSIDWPSGLHQPKQHELEFLSSNSWMVMFPFRKDESISLFATRALSLADDTRGKNGSRRFRLLFINDDSSIRRIIVRPSITDVSPFISNRLKKKRNEKYSNMFRSVPSLFEVFLNTVTKKLQWKLKSPWKVRSRWRLFVK